MNLRFTLPKAIRLFWCIVLTLPFASNLSAQVGNSFEGVATNLNCTNSTGCNYNDPGSATVVHALMDNNGIPVSQMSSGSVLGYSIVYTPTRTLDSDGSPGLGLTDNQRFGVATSIVFNDQLGAPVADGLQGFFMEDTDGEVEMTFDPVELTGTTMPLFFMQYNLGPADWENTNGANDRFYARLDIDNCASATTITLLDTDGGGENGGGGGDIDLNAMVTEGAWRTLMADLTAYIGCQATLIIEFDSDATNEELGIDGIIFSQGSVANNNSIVCPTVGAVSGDAVVCAGDPFDLTATGLANMASADNMEQDFGIEFKYFGSATSDPYNGGTSLGTVAFGSLTAGGTTAALVGATIPAADPSAFIYAVLSPAPTDLTCRPSAQTLIEVESPAAAPIVEDVNACGGNTALIVPMNGATLAPVQFWTEDFAEDGAGITGVCSGADPATCATNVAPANGQWSIAGDALGLIAVSDFLQVNGGALVAQDLDAELCFLSEIIDISGYSSVDFSVLIEEEGDHEVADYVDVNIIVDGADNILADWMGMGSATHTLTGDIPDDGDFMSTTVTAMGLTGSTLQVEICMFNGAAAEMFKLDDITLSGTPVSGMFNFYDADPGAGPANLLAGPAASFDAGATPRSIWVTEVTAACESEASEVVVSDEDAEAPVITGCPTTLSDGVVGLTSCLNATPNYAAFITVTDDCDDNPTVVQIPPTGTMLGVGMFEIKLVATDAAGNASDTCRFTLNNTDITPPEALCQDIEVFLDAAGNASIVAADVDGGSTDNCGIASLAVSPADFDCDDIANNPNSVTLTVTDNSGNPADCTSNVTVRDTISPVLTCQNASYDLNAAGEFTLFVGQIEQDIIVSSTDNCELITGQAGIGVSQFNFTCDDLGDNEITILNNDVNGNQGSCTITLTIADPNAFCCAAPVASCTGTTVELDANGMASIMASTIGAGSTAGCGLASETVVPSTFDCDDIGPNTVTYTITDINGAMSQCTTSVTVNDVMAPVVTCTEFTETFSDCPDGLGPNVTGAIITIGIDSSILSAVGGSFIGTLDFRNGCVSDNCTDLANIDLEVVASFQENTVPGCSTDIINQYVALDEAGNESADTITFRATIMYDGPAPEITCPADSLINCGVVPTVMASDATATSGCGTPVVTVSDAVIAGEPNEIGTTYTFTFTATDGCGQTSTCDQVFTVQDTIAPIVTCTEFSETFSGEDQCADAIGANSPTGTFSTIGDLTMFSVAAGGSRVATFDLSGCVSDDCASTGLQAAFVDSYEENRVAGCSVDIINVLVIRDAADNEAEDSIFFRSTIMYDGPAPEITCPADSLIECGVFPAVVTDNITATSGCGTPTISVSENPVVVGEPDVPGTTYTYTVTATDGCGQTSTCERVFIVQDLTPPVLVCRDTTVYVGEDGTFELDLSELIVSATDNCSVTDTIAPPIILGCGDIPQTPRLFDDAIGIIDIAGLETRCSPTITVLDSIKPEVVCLDIEVFLDENGAGGYAELDLFTATDNCDVDFAPFDQAFPLGCDDIGVIDVPLTVSDINGNSFSCTATVTVADTTRPVLVCQDITVFLDDMGVASVTDTTLAIMSLSDNCTDSTSIVIALDAPMLGCDLMPGTATLTATDASGNTATCTFGLEPRDTTPPAAICLDITVQLDDQGNGSIASADNTSSQIDGGSTDNCESEGLTFSESMTEFTCDNVGPNTVTLTVTDASGNMSTCDATVTVEDMVPPVITVTPQTVVLSDDDGTATLTVGQLASATDACGVESLTASQLLYTCEDIGEVEVIITATDVNGNVSTAPVTVTVEFNQPELACIGEINLTLNDECQALLIPRMVLTGNVACLDVFNWDIVVQDDDPSNGPIIDGCGSFTYSISAGSNGDEPTIGFTGDFAPENWFGISATFPNPPNFPGPLSDDQLTSATFTDDELVMTTQALVFNTGVSFGIQQVLMFSEAGELNFDYNFNGVDAGFDDAISLVTFEGFNIVAIPFNTDMPESGSVTLDIEPGYTLNFLLMDNGLQPLAPNADLPSVLTIDNFVFTPPTSPFDLDFETCWGIVNAEDKTSPEADFVPEDVTLLCVDFESDANNVATLPNSISRCYRVDAETGATIAGSMAPALRARLLAGGLTPLVPTFTDGCAQELEVCVSDAVAFGEDADCDDIVLTRTFVATEISTCVSVGGEMNAPAVASYTITFDRPTLADLNTDGIQDVVEYEQCGTVNPTRADYPAPRAGDFPSLIVGDRVFNLRSGEAVCNIGVTYSDGAPIVTCPYTYKFIRTYTVIDWCDPSDVRTFIQVVKVGDTTAPVLTGPNVATNDAGDLVYGTNAGNICAAYLRLDDISVVDNCSGTNVSVSAEIFPGGDDTGAPIGAFTVVPGGTPELSSAIPAGRHLLRYTSTDECGNTSIDDFFFVIEDQTPPVAICEDGLNISLGSAGNSTGFAVLTPENIDNGSYDDCSGVSLSIARVNSSDLPIGTYGPQITLTCADLGTVRVGLRVEDALGNVNYCWLDVLVEDKLRPTCVAPANTTITCIEYNNSMPADIQDATSGQLDAVFGTAAGVDNCGTTITQTISGGVNSCGVGFFTRTFVSTDDAGFTNAGACTQRIDVIGIHDYRLTFPTDESGDCADIPEYDGVGAEELACDLITTTTDVDTLRTLEAGDECFKLRITYDVVNWCEYNSLGDPYLVTRDGSGVNNRQRQPRNIDEDVLYVNVIPNNTAGTGDDQAFMTLFTDRALNTNAPQRDQEFVGYAGSDSRGFFRYTQFIKIYDEVAPEITFTELDECFAGSGEGCRTTVTIEFTALDECSDAVVGLELDANYVEAAGFNPDNAAALGIGVTLDNDGEGNYTVTATNVPVGAHALRVRASDGCGNFDVQIIEFCVTADRTPTPICIQTLTVVLMDDGNGGGTAAIWASDFIASPIEDCFGNEVTKYSLFRSSEAGAAGFVPSFDPPATNGIDDIDCDDFEAGTVSVRVYAFDDNGSTPDYCEVIVEVQDNMGWCDDGGSGNIAGLITDQDDVAVDNVSVTLTGGMEMTTTTDASGQYRFAGLPLNVDYTVQPELDAPVNLRNVKSSDLVSMIGQILGTTTFDSPYDFVAADVNGDMELNIFDVVNVSQVILGQVDLFDGGESWVFVEAGAVIDVANPYAATFPEVYNANDLAGTITADFVAVEMGNPFGLSSRTALNLTTDDAQLEAGQTHTIVLDGTELAAFQGTLELGAGLELIGAEYTGEGGMNLNRAGEGMIAVALRTPSPTPPHGGGATENASRFGVTLTVRATTAVTLSEELSLTDAITVREGVGANGVGNGLDLAFNGELAPATAQNVLHQNTPNPVSLETVIRFELAQAAPATLTLRDAAGRLISVQEIDAAAGMNMVELTNIKASGVLTYTLTSGDFTASRKMVVVK